jgi:peptide/nickel transport system permease protein
MTVAVAGVAFLGPLAASHSPTAFVGSPFAPSSSGLPLGTDVLGRDVTARVLDGGWVLMMMAFAATALGVGGGFLIGVIAGYRSGWVDSVLMRAADVLLAFPQLVLALLFVSVLGPRIWLIVIAVALAHAPQVARVIRSSTLDISERDFVTAAELQRIGSRRVVSRELAPNLTSIVMVELGLRLTWSILLIASLSFIGFGLQPPDANWGLMINENRVGLGANPLPVLVPVALIAVLTIGVNTYTDAIARTALGADGAVEVGAIGLEGTGATNE